MKQQVYVRRFNIFKRLDTYTIKKCVYLSCIAGLEIWLLRIKGSVTSHLGASFKPSVIRNLRCRIPVRFVYLLNLVLLTLIATLESSKTQESPAEESFFLPARVNISVSTLEIRDSVYVKDHPSHFHLDLFFYYLPLV